MKSGWPEVRWEMSEAALLSAIEAVLEQQAADKSAVLSAVEAFRLAADLAREQLEERLRISHIDLETLSRAVLENKTALSLSIEALRLEYVDLAHHHTALVGKHVDLDERHAALNKILGSARQEIAFLEDRLGRSVWEFMGDELPGANLFALRKNQRVLLVQVAPTIADELSEFAPERKDILAWAADPSLKWNISGQTPQAVGSRAFWPLEAVYGIRNSLRDNADSRVWNHVVTSDCAPSAPSPWPYGWRPQDGGRDARQHRLMILLGIRTPELLHDLHSFETVDELPETYPPLEEARDKVSSVPAEPRKRSVLFVNPAYYNFLHLAKALRKRGWDAVSMGFMGPYEKQTKFFHGVDFNLFDPDPVTLQRRLETWFREAVGRFDMFHFHGIGAMSIFPSGWDISSKSDRVPWDVLEMKRRGAKIAYTITGCHDLVTQTSFDSWSMVMCPKCPHRDEPDICSDHRMSAWGWKVRQLADLICVETDPPLDFRDSPQTFREPLSFALDPDHWNPEFGRSISPPAEWQESKRPGEILIYHSVGNYTERTREGVNVKGTSAVIRAIDRLASEGYPVRLLFRDGVPSVYNHWILGQADIIVDQLNYGRYGATAREGLMLGRPVVGRLNPLEPGAAAPVRCIAESPIVDANEETIYDVLKRLVSDPGARERIGQQSRAHALRWWSNDVLAERYERVYDHLRLLGRPPLTLEQ